MQTTSTHPFVSSSATGVDRITKNATTTNTIQFPIVATRSYPFGSPLIDVLGVYHAFGPGLDQEVEGARHEGETDALGDILIFFVDQNQTRVPVNSQALQLNTQSGPGCVAETSTGLPFGPDQVGCPESVEVTAVQA